VGDLLQHTGRTLLVVVAIAVGLAGAGVILNAWALMRVATTEGFRASDPPAATLRLNIVDSALLARARAVPGVRDVQARRVTMARAQVAGRTLQAMLFTAPDFSAVRIGAIAPKVGEWPAMDGTLALESSSVEFSGVAVDDVVQLSVGSAAPYGVPVRGIVRDVTLAPGWMEHVLYGFVSRATLDSMRAPSTMNELQLVVHDPTLDQDGVRRIARAVEASARAAGYAVLDVHVPVPGEHIHAPQMDSLLYTQGAFALMALALSGFLVVNLIAAMLVGQTREIGVMKAIGGRSQQIAAMYLAVAALLGTAAVALAVPLSLWLGREYAQVKADLLNFEIAGYRVPAWVVVLQVVVGILLPVLAAAFPVWHACRMPVSDALRDVGIDGRVQAGGLVYRVRGVSRPILLSLRNAFRRRQRMALTLLALASGGAVFLGALNLRASVLRATDFLFGSQRYHFALRLAAPQSPDSVEAIVRVLSGVEAAEGWTGARATVDHGGGVIGNAFPITAPPAGSALLQPMLLSGRWFAPGDDRVLVVNRAVQREDSALQLGATVRLGIGGDTASWTVVGVVETTPGAAAYAPRSAILSRNGGGVGTVMVRSALTGEASQLELVQRARAALADRGIGVASSTMIAEARRQTEDHLLMVVDFLGAMGWLMLVVGGLALASTMGLAVLERTREIGVLRAIGARHTSILTMIQVEGLTIALLSWGLAIPLSVPMSVLLAQAFSRIMLRVPVTYVPNGTGVLIWLALVVVVSVVACAWPAVRAMRVPTAAALAYD
jgi:putative ABC transport system permease protein